MMDVCYSGFLYTTLRTFNLSFYSLKQCITLHKNSGGAGAKIGGLERRERRHWVVHELLPNLVVWFGQPAGIQNAIVEVW